MFAKNFSFLVIWFALELMAIILISACQCVNGLSEFFCDECCSVYSVSWSIN